MTSPGIRLCTVRHTCHLHVANELLDQGDTVEQTSDCCMGSGAKPGSKTDRVTDLNYLFMLIYSPCVFITDQVAAYFLKFIVRSPQVLVLSWCLTLDHQKQTTCPVAMENLAVKDIEQQLHRSMGP